MSCHLIMHRADFSMGSPFHGVTLPLPARFLDMVGLRQSMHVKASQLSGGQRRHLSVALAFIGGSQTIILDEPTSGIDPFARRSIWDLIVRHRQGQWILILEVHLHPYN